MTKTSNPTFSSSESNEDKAHKADESSTVKSLNVPDGSRVVEVRVVETPGVPEAPKSEEVDKEFYVAQRLDPRRLTPGTSPYLDDVDRANAEVQRAKVEGREPDLDNPPATQSTLMLETEVAEGMGLSTAKVDPDSTLPVSVVA